ncbi:MAG: hypothetical protein IKJ74_05870 [Clostridia bacterium]|nr:hypothetical protein [Clostridia bacterium]
MRFDFTQKEKSGNGAAASAGAFGGITPCEFTRPQIEADGEQNLMGCRVFQTKPVIGGVPRERINVAVTPENEVHLEKIKNTFALLDEENSGAFAALKGFCMVDEYAVYSFSFPKDRKWVQFSKLSENQQQDHASGVFKSLVKILFQYNRSAIHESGYRPLGFLCKDCIYVSVPQNESEKISVMLLPLPVPVKPGYAGMPGELFTPGADVSTDLYMAAYFYFYAKYPGGTDKAFESQEMCIERCLSPLKYRRPGLEALIRDLKIDMDDNYEYENQKGRSFSFDSHGTGTGISRDRIPTGNEKKRDRIPGGDTLEDDGKEKEDLAKKAEKVIPFLKKGMDGVSDFFSAVTDKFQKATLIEEEDTESTVEEDE